MVVEGEERKDVQRILLRSMGSSPPRAVVVPQGSLTSNVGAENEATMASVGSWTVFMVAVKV